VSVAALWPLLFASLAASILARKSATRKSESSENGGTCGAVAKVNAVKLPESVEIYSDLIMKEPKEGRFYTLRASAWCTLGKPDRAVADFDRAIELGYDAAHAYTSRGLFHAEAGNFEKAIADYAKAIEKDPKDTAPLVNRAAIPMAKIDHQAAVDDSTKAIEQKLNNMALLHQRGVAFKAAGKLDQRRATAF